MQEAESRRVEQIRASAAAEKPKIAALDDQITDSYLKQLLQKASFDLDDVETFLLPQAAKAQPMFVSMVLDTAELVLKIAMQRRQYVQKMVDTYGPDVMSIGG